MSLNETSLSKLQPRILSTPFSTRYHNCTSGNIMLTDKKKELLGGHRYYCLYDYPSSSYPSSSYPSFYPSLSYPSLSSLSLSSLSYPSLSYPSLPYPYYHGYSWY